MDRKHWSFHSGATLDTFWEPFLIRRFCNKLWELLLQRITKAAPNRIDIPQDAAAATPHGGKMDDFVSDGKYSPLILLGRFGFKALDMHFSG